MVTRETGADTSFSLIVDVSAISMIVRQNRITEMSEIINNSVLDFLHQLSSPL